MIRNLLLPIAIFYLALAVAMGPVYLHKELRKSDPRVEPSVEIITERGSFTK